LYDLTYPGQIDMHSNPSIPITVHRTLVFNIKYSIDRWTDNIVLTWTSAVWYEWTRILRRNLTIYHSMFG